MSTAWSQTLLLSNGLYFSPQKSLGKMTSLMLGRRKQRTYKVMLTGRERAPSASTPGSN